MITTINVTSNKTLGSFSTTRIMCLCSTASGNVTLTLESAAKNRGQELIIKHVTAGNTLTVSPQLGETISGSSSYTSTTAGDLLTLVSDGTNYISTASTGGWVGTATSALDMGGFNITNVGTVDGVDVSTLNTTVSGHLDGGANKHDASEIDVENAYTYLGTSVTDLESVFNSLDDNLGYRIVVQPTTTSTNLQSAIDTLEGLSSGAVQLLPGAYTLTSQISIEDSKNITIRGAGDATVLTNTTLGDAIFKIASATGASYNLSSTTKTATSVSTSTAANAGNFSSGDIVRISGTDSLSFLDQEINEVTGVNAGTGQIDLKYPVRFSLTSPTIQRVCGLNTGRSVSIEDLKIVGSQSTASNYAFSIANAAFVRLKNLVLDSFDQSAINITNVSHLLIDGCVIKNVDIDAIRAISSSYIRIKKTIFRNTNVVTTSSGAISFLNSVYDTMIDSCDIVATPRGLYLGGISSITSRRINASNNSINASENGIFVSQGIDCVFNGNSITGISNDYAIHLQGAYTNDCSVIGNNIHECAFGYAMSQGAYNCLFNGNVISKTQYDAVVIANVTTGGYSVQNNTITDTGRYALWCASSNAGVWTGNNVHKAVRGVYLQDGNENIVGMNNIQSCTSEAILLNTACTANQVAWNHTHGGTITDQGTSNVVSFNL